MKALIISDLHKIYKSGVKAVEGISLEIGEGDIYALLGPNGAGKTTTIGIISSLVNKTSGTVKVFGKNLDEDRNKVKSFIGLVPQEMNFNIFEKVRDIVVQQAGYYGITREKALKRSEVLLKKLGLWEKRDTKSMQLSGGMKRKLMIVRALMHKPKLLILDEPTAGVDVETRREMWDFFKEINKEGTTIILTTHYLEEAEHLCRNIAIIDKGKIIQSSTMKQILQTLDKETFILDVTGDLSLIHTIPGMVQIDKNTLELTIEKEKDLNRIFKVLDSQKVKVLSLRNKSNRLEELFVRLTKK
jgi:ABC-2 type transport system ATP-binding protein